MPNHMASNKTVNSQSICVFCYFAALKIHLVTKTVDNLWCDRNHYLTLWRIQESLMVVVRIDSTFTTVTTTVQHHAVILSDGMFSCLVLPGMQELN